MTSIASDLKHWRHTFQLTQQKAAYFLDCSAGHLSRIERGEHDPPPATCARYRLVIDAMFEGAAMQKDWAPL